MSLQFVVTEQPSIKKTVKIIQGQKGQGKNLNLQWDGSLNRHEAAELLRYAEESSSPYYTYDANDNEIPVSHNEAVEKWVNINIGGESAVVHQLHEGVFERKADDMIQRRDDFFRAMIIGCSYETDDGTELEGQCLLKEWDLVDTEKASLDFQDEEVFDMVFSHNEFFFPVWDSMLEVLKELASGRDKTKNSKSSGMRGRKKTGRFKA